MSNMLESLAQTRHAERYNDAQRATSGGETAGKLHRTRTQAGWLLVGLGLRLALPGRQDAATRTTLVGR